MKEGYYFPHFTNARNDIKLLKIRRVLGLEGYAIYFMLLEILREQTDFKYKIENIPELEFEFRTSKEKIFDVISNYDLFIIDNENKFFSIKLIENLQPYLEKSSRAKVAALKRWDKCKVLLENNDTNVMQMQSKCNTNAEANVMQLNKSKVNKIKENEINKIKEFYKFEIENNINNINIEKYKKLVSYFENTAKDFLKLKEQLKFKEFEVLLNKCLEKSIKLYDIVNIAVNTPSYLKRKQSIYLTLNTWINNQPQKKSINNVDNSWEQRQAVFQQVQNIIKNQ